MGMKYEDESSYCGGAICSLWVKISVVTAIAFALQCSFGTVLIHDYCARVSPFFMRVWPCAFLGQFFVLT